MNKFILNYLENIINNDYNRQRFMVIALCNCGENIVCILSHRSDNNCNLADEITII